IQVFTSVPDESTVDKKDLCIVIGNLVDNAVEAVKKCSGEKMIKINIDEDPSGIYIDIENTYEGSLLPDKKLFKTTKSVKTGHGIGLGNVSQVVDKYAGEMAFDITDNIFRIEVDMYKS
ncbi:MAG: ATP-binding protein, partial [Bacillota bacterium]|nr:ATP-binding protein [Bacillota bacterium]